MRIDAHQHFWVYSEREYTWMGPDMGALRRDFLPEHLEPLMRECGVSATIAVQARQTIGETEWLLSLAEHHPWIVGVVGWVDLCDPRVEDDLDRFAGRPRFVGVRHVLEIDPDDRYMLRPDFLRGIAALMPRDLVYDIVIRYRQLPAASELVARFPGQRFVLDHIGKPPIASGQLQPWERDLRRLATSPDVWCKVSGMVTEASHDGWSASDMRPYLDVVFDAFGPQRLLLGSDWPVCTLAADYRRTMDLVLDYIAPLADLERAAIEWVNAARVYRLELPHIRVRESRAMTTAPGSTQQLLPQMRAWHERLLGELAARGVAFEPYPAPLGRGADRGVAAARAYPIQGVLKYHGLADWSLRTAYLPSVSVTNDAACTLTLVEFDPLLEADEVTINGEPAAGRPLQRVVDSLDAVRRVAGIASRARVASRNLVRATRTGKGLGTSASASAALAAAALAATLGPHAIRNRRFLSCMARLLAGSGCRSATGGLSLWLSYQGASHEDAFSVRLDQRGELDDLRLITVPIESRLGLATESAHLDAPHSPLFPPWMASRGEEILECLDATLRGDWRTIGQLAELDSIRLHAVTMTGSRENKVFAWEHENIALFRLCNRLRSAGVPVYFSTDTGPTTVFFTHRSHEDAVAAGIASLGMGLEVVRGKMAGPAELVPMDEARAELGL